MAQKCVRQKPTSGRVKVHKLSTENLLLVFTEVFKLRAQWENIGLALEFNPGALDAMKGPYKDPKDSLKDMIKEWLKTFDDCCWERLVESLRHPIVGEVNFAKTLEEKYCTGGSEPSAGTSIPALDDQDSSDSSDSGSLSDHEPTEPDVYTTLDSKWALLIKNIVNQLNVSDKALQNIKIALEHRVLSKPTKSSSATPQKTKESKSWRKVRRIVTSSGFTNARNVRELFSLLAHRSHWNWIHYHLLEFVVEASDCQSSMEMLKEFLQLREALAPFVFVPMTKDSHLQNGGLSSQPEPPTDDVEIEVKTDKESLTVEEYDRNTTCFSAVAAIPKMVLGYFGAGRGCIATYWRISRHVIPHILHCMRINEKVLRALAELRVVEIRIGAYFHIVVPTLAYWEGKRVVEACEIFEACGRGNLEGVLECLDLGVEVDAQDEHKQTPLIVASRSGYAAIVQALLDRNASIHAQDKNGWTALARASCEGHVEVVDVLLRAGAEPDVSNSTRSWVTPLMYASSRGHLPVVESLLSSRADPNLRTKNGSTALMKAADKGHPDIIVKLLQAGADVDVQNEEGTTALMEASNRGYEGAVKELLAARADVNQQDKYDETALVKASYFCYHAIVELLLRGGADPNIPTQDGRTPLMLSVKKLEDHELEQEFGITWDGRYKTIKVLLKYKADVNFKEPASGWTSLFFAAQDGDIDYVKLLLGHDANANIEGKKKLTALDVANGDEVHKELMKYRQSKSQSLDPRKVVAKLKEVMVTVNRLAEERLRRKKLSRRSSEQDESKEITLLEIA